MLSDRGTEYRPRSSSASIDGAAAEVKAIEPSLIPDDPLLENLLDLA